MYATSLISSMVSPSLGSMIGSFSSLGLSSPALDSPVRDEAPGPNASRATTPGGGDAFSSHVMDTLLTTAGRASPPMQVLLFVYRLLGADLGLDPSALLALLGFLWALSKIAAQVFEHVEGLVDRYFMCAMSVSEDDQIYQHLMKWLSSQPSIRNNQFLMAQSAWRSAWEEEDELDEALLWTDGDGEGGDKKYLNFSRQEARSNPRFVPAMGFTSFWHKGTYFRLNRRKESLVNTRNWGSALKDVEEMRISCFGRSIEPIKQLLVDAKAFFYLDDDQKTTIYRPRVREQRREYHLWQQVARRPVRPMSTVVLDAAEKRAVMDDVNEYLHPATPRWYARRGIPLRRGYLFHGPPGTGKTSFSFALAGVFGIDIYVVSLQDTSVTEMDLSTLFTKLPRRCIVLLEDIDIAGLRRDGGGGGSDTGEDGGGARGEGRTRGDKAKGPGEQATDSDGGGSAGTEGRRTATARKRAAARAGPDKDATPSEGISLSGLLNAIDGVASHEGRILIMTTNRPESLDEALIRPGRVDVQVRFTNATSTQATELFYRMYEASRPKQQAAAAGEASAKVAESGLEAISREEMGRIAGEFGRRIPGNTFSPAEIQGFLLKRKKSPRKALEDVAGWVEASLRQKEANSRITSIQ